MSIKEGSAIKPRNFASLKNTFYATKEDIFGKEITHTIHIKSSNIFLNHSLQISLMNIILIFLVTTSVYHLIMLIHTSSDGFDGVHYHGYAR